jgi:hypothetical protein
MNPMSILLTSWDWRSLWENLPLTSNLYLVYICVLVVFTVFLDMRIWRRLKQFKKSPDNKSIETLSGLQSRMTSLRQLHVFSFLMFGICVTDQFFSSVRAVTRASWCLVDTTNAFDPLAWFAYLVFVQFLAIHALQWFVSSRLQAEARFAVD